VFDTLDTEDAARLIGHDPSQEAADVVHEVRVRFVRELEPGCGHYRSGTRATMVFGHDTRVVDDPGSSTPALWGVGSRTGGPPAN
jgi:hypothetical protein